MGNQSLRLKEWQSLITTTFALLMLMIQPFLKGYYFYKAYGWQFYFFSWLKPNLRKSEIAGIGVLKGVQVAVCGMSCIDLNNDALKILATHFSYNKKIERRKKMFKTLTDIQRVLKIWEMRNLTIEGEIFIFKTKTISKTVFQSFRTTVRKYVLNKLEKKQKAFLWNNFTPKIKHEILCNEYKAGGLKNVDIGNKVIALQCSWIRRFYDDSFHE